MKTRKLMTESLLSILTGVIFFLYRWRMLQNTLDFFGKDFIYSMVIAPLFYFVLAYILGRWMFHAAVGAVHQKAIHILFSSEAVILCLYLLCVVFTALMKYVFTQYTVTQNTVAWDLVPWVQGTFLESCYVRIFAFGGSAVHLMICVFAGIFFALAITGKGLEHE